MKPELILDRTEACRTLGISRQTLLTWIRKGKLKIWKRVGHGSNAALLFERRHVETLITQKQAVAEPTEGEKSNMIRGIQVGLGILLSLCLVSESYAVGSSGFSTQFMGAKALGQGNAFVAEADDPSTVYFNPAGMTQLKGNQVSVGGAALMAMTTRSGEGVSDDHMKKQLSLLPNFYATASKPFGLDKIAVGVGLNSPFGLSTEWAPTSSVAYVTTESAFETISINPSVAMEVASNLSVGVGADYVNAFNVVSRSQTNQAGANQAVGAVGDTSPDGTSKLSGHGSGWGYNAGVLFKPFERHSFGASYRSQVKIPIKGSVELNNLSASTQADFNFAGTDYSADATSSIILPASAIFGYAYKPTERWTLLADYEWTQWNTFQSQDVAIHESDPFRLAFLTADPTSNVSHTARDWRNVSSVGGGANYKIDDAWQVRGGYAFYQRTAPQETFSPDIPDAAVHVLTTGFSRSWTRLVLDFAFNAYIYSKRDINNTVGNTVGASVNGTYKTFAPAVALNLTYKFGG